jgi:hypothetical protein
VRDFPVIDSAQLCPFQGDHGYSFACDSCKLHFIRPAVLINMDNRTYVARSKLFRRQIGCKDHPLMFFDLTHNGTTKG